MGIELPYPEKLDALVDRLLSDENVEIGTLLKTENHLEQYYHAAKSRDEFDKFAFVLRTKQLRRRLANAVAAAVCILLVLASLALLIFENVFSVSCICGIVLLALIGRCAVLLLTERDKWFWLGGYSLGNSYRLLPYINHIDWEIQTRRDKLLQQKY